MRPWLWIAEYVVPAPARVNATATCDVTIPAGPTGMEPSQTGFFQIMNIATKINKGSVEILSEVTVVREGEKAGGRRHSLPCPHQPHCLLILYWCTRTHSPHPPP